jgi:hypothetical protein
MCSKLVNRREKSKISQISLIKVANDLGECRVSKVPSHLRSGEEGKFQFCHGKYWETASRLEKEVTE